MRPWPQHILDEMGDHVDVKLHTDHFAGSGLPMDLSGCECLVSMDSTTVRDPDSDDKPDEFYHETISSQRSVGQNIIITLATTGPVAYTP